MTPAFLRRLPRFFLLFAGAACVAASGATITGLTAINLSDPDYLATTTGRTTEFRTELAHVSGITTTGLESSFSSHLRWMLADEVDADGPRFALGFSRHVGLEFQFTVLDPTNLGYSLSFDGAIRGYLRAIYSPGTATATVPVQVNGTTIYSQLDSGSGFANVPFFQLSGGTAQATEAAPTSNVLVQTSDSHQSALFTGTRSFRLQFDTLPSVNVGSIMQNYADGQTSARFGMDPSHADLDAAFYANAPDGEGPGNHGLFVNVKVVSAAPQPVPVASHTLALLLGAMALLRVARRFAPR